MAGHALNAALTSAMYQLTSEKRFHRPSRCHVGKAGEKGREGKRKGGREESGRTRKEKEEETTGKEKERSTREKRERRKKRGRS